MLDEMEMCSGEQAVAKNYPTWRENFSHNKTKFIKWDPGWTKKSPLGWLAGPLPEMACPSASAMMKTPRGACKNTTYNVRMLILKHMFACAGV